MDSDRSNSTTLVVGVKSKQRLASIWIPPGVETLRGIFCPGGIIIGKQLAESGNFRAILAEHQMGVLLAQVWDIFMIQVWINVETVSHTNWS